MWSGYDQTTVSTLHHALSVYVTTFIYIEWKRQELCDKFQIHDRVFFFYYLRPLILFLAWNSNENFFLSTLYV